jgi:hypothetical protein
MLYFLEDDLATKRGYGALKTKSSLKKRVMVESTIFVMWARDKSITFVISIH